VTAILSMLIGIVGKIIWDWLNGKSRNGIDAQVGEVAKALTVMKNQIRTLAEFHEKTDGAGRPLAYFNNNAIEKIDNLSRDLKSLPVVLANILGEIKSLHATLSNAIKNNS
jgi:hypothetical protein